MASTWTRPTRRWCSRHQPAAAFTPPVRCLCANQDAKYARPDDLLQRLRRFHDDHYPGLQGQFQHLVQDGQHPNILFIGCSDSRLLPYLLTGTGPGEVFMIRNVGAFVPPHDGFIEGTHDDADGSPLAPGRPGNARRWVG